MTSEGTSTKSAAAASKSRLLDSSLRRATMKSSGLARRTAATSDRFVVSLSVAATKPAASPNRARSSTAGSTPYADDDRRIVHRRNAGLDDRHLEPLRTQVRDDLLAEAAVAADHPAPARRLAPRRQLGAGLAGQPLDQAERRRRAQRNAQVIAEAVERVDDRGLAECPHALRDLRQYRARDDRQVRAEQRRRHRDREVRLVVVGEGDHALADGGGRGRQAQVLRVAGVGGEPRHVGAERLEVEVVDAGRIDVDDDHAAA